MSQLEPANPENRLLGLPTSESQTRSAQQSLDPWFLQFWYTLRRRAIQNQVKRMRQTSLDILNQYSQIRFPSLADEKMLTSRLRYTANILAVFRTRSANYLVPAAGLGVSWMFIFLGSPFIINFWLHHEGTLGSWLKIYVLYFLEFYLLLLIPALPALTQRSRIRRKLPSNYFSKTLGTTFSLLGIIVVYVIGIYLYLTRFIETFPRTDMILLLAHVNLAVLFTYAMELITFILAGIWIYIMYFFVDQPFEKAHVDAMIIHHWISLILDLEKHATWWNDLAYKRSITRQLEQLARRIERNLPVQLASGDAATDAWLKGVARQFGASLRDKKKAVLTPKTDSYLFLLDALKADFFCVVTGNWDSVSRKDPERLNASTLREKIQRALIILGQGLLPLIIFFALRNYWPGMSQQFSETFLSGAIIWFILSILLELDPDFKEKLDLLKTVREVTKL